MANFSCVLSSADYVFKMSLLKNIYFRNTFRVSNSLDQDLDQDCLQRLSADDTSNSKVTVGVVFGKIECGLDSLAASIDFCRLLVYFANDLSPE